MIPRSKTTILSYKGFEFPICLTEFALVEDAKIATYEYAGRDGAEHERVLNYRVFKVSGIFITESGTSEPSFYVNSLRSLNDNQPGRLFHKDFGGFDCIMKNLQITQSPEEYENITTTADDTEVDIQNFKFSIEFWENKDPAAINTEDALSKLFPAFNTKPFSDYYDQNLRYANANEMFIAIKKGNLIPGTDPIENSEWLLYDYDLRQEAFSEWIDYLEAGGYDHDNTISTDTDSVYTVQPGDTAFTIAATFKISVDELYNINKGFEVREAPKGDEGLLWKTSSQMFSGDKITIPGQNYSAQEAVTIQEKKDQIAQSESVSQQIDSRVSTAFGH